MVELDHQRSTANTSVNKMRLDIFVLFNIFNYCRFASYSEFAFHHFNSFWWIMNQFFCEWNLKIVLLNVVWISLYIKTQEPFLYSEQTSSLVWVILRPSTTQPVRAKPHYFQLTFLQPSEPHLPLYPICFVGKQNLLTPQSPFPGSVPVKARGTGNGLA